MRKLLIEVNERDFNDFEQFKVLFILEMSDFNNFIDFAPKYLLPVTFQSDLRMSLTRMGTFEIGKIDNFSNNLPH